MCLQAFKRPSSYKSPARLRRQSNVCRQLTDHTCRVPSADPAAAWRSSAPKQARHQTPPTWKLGARSVRSTWKLRQSVSFSRSSFPHVSTVPARDRSNPESHTQEHKQQRWKLRQSVSFSRLYFLHVSTVSAQGRSSEWRIYQHKRQLCNVCQISGGAHKGVPKADQRHPISYHAVLWTGSHAAPRQYVNSPGFQMCRRRGACLSGCRWRRR